VSRRHGGRARAPQAVPRRGKDGGDARHRREDEDLPPLREWEVALLSTRGRFLTAEPFFGPGRRLVVDRVQHARPGDLVLLRLPRPGARKGAGHAKIQRVIGRPDVARDVLEALMLDRGLARRFPPGVEKAAEDARDALAEGGGSKDPGAAGRVDLRDLPTFTIDPPTARDFDDAISCEQLGPEHWRVWVHIADVAAYVRPGSAIDREALRRGTSVYVPGKVEPMLPEALSNDACSLRPHVDRLAVTVEWEQRGADVVSARFTRSQIRSDERLDYPQVDRMFAGAEQPAERIAAPLAAARAAAAALGRRRAEQGGLELSSAEPEFRFDRAGHVSQVDPEEATESHRLIEHLMICANERVATLLDSAKVPALYRVHERPSGEGAARLLEQLASLDVPTPPAPERMSATEAAHVVAEAARMVADHVRRTGRGRQALTSLVLRALKQARYQPENIGHAGLSSERYCHFTSPIRRYPDLVCHRALLSAVGGGEEAPRPGTLEELGTQTSARERDAMGIERAADDVALAFLLERELFEHGWDRTWDGEVVGLIGAGAFVAFEGFRGMLPVRRMHGDWWELNEEGTILHGEETGATLRLGDPISVRVRHVDTARGRVDLDAAS
jgi:ribonuclease R